jgi:hypothetical protein
MYHNQNKQKFHGYQSASEKTDRLSAAVGEASADFCGYKVLHGQCNRSQQPLISVF